MRCVALQPESSRDDGNRALVRTFFNDVLIAEHEDNASVLDAEPIVQNFEVFTKRLLVVTAAQRYLKQLPRTHFYSNAHANMFIICYYV